MPPIAGKPKTPAKAKKAKAPVERPVDPVIYPTLQINGVDVPQADITITAEDAKVLLGWETEEEYVERMRNEDPGKEAEQLSKDWLDGSVRDADDRVVDLIPPLFKDKHGKQVKCLRNTRNRPFGEETANQYAQSILERQWAGAANSEKKAVYPWLDGNELKEIELDEYTTNGETIIIGRTGQVLSGQHRLVGLVFAHQLWELHPEKWGEKWPNPPSIETLIVFGVSEHEKVIGTLDNVRQRTEADTIFTSQTFRMDANGNPYKPAERRELARMLATATDFLFKRTGHEGMPTLQALASFRDRHKRIEDCVRHLFEENKGRAISKLELSPGTCAAIMYLQASCHADIDLYRNGDPRSESGGKYKLPFWKVIKEMPTKLTAWDKAEEFWVGMSSGAGEFKAVHEALKMLKDPDTDDYSEKNPQLVPKRIAVLAHAWSGLHSWNVNEKVGGFLEGKIKPNDLKLEYRYEDETGNPVLNEWPSFGGIDDPKPIVARKGDAAGTKLTPEQMEEAKEQERLRAAEDQKELVRKSKEVPTPKKPASLKVLKQPEHKAEPKVNGKPEAKAKKPTPQQLKQTAKAKAADDADLEAKIIKVLTDDATNVSDLSVLCDADQQTVVEIVTRLESEGTIAKDESLNYSIA